MSRKTKAPTGWGELNIALNGLVREGTILSYSTSMASGTPSVEVAIESGADQAEVVRRVRGALPSAFADAQVRTRVG
ncbi:hypothetical protein [Enterovirga aerilata]|uniref:Uncharacterized protein n=1 Tax=Enterovirga aerilata TaxID=2730920 RepID=A0A849I4R8_9HYPH|nr:hypothetical protein [Enterovirga sp. DB1703]NNM72358.1 hypothetical protein [Enterovirga sp. DB1703]